MAEDELGSYEFFPDTEELTEFTTEDEVKEYAEACIGAWFQAGEWMYDKYIHENFSSEQMTKLRKFLLREHTSNALEYWEYLKRESAE